MNNSSDTDANQKLLPNLLDAVRKLLEQAPQHGLLALEIHVRHGIAVRYNTKIETSIAL
jgi:hypothetical protein